MAPHFCGGRAFQQERVPQGWQEALQSAIGILTRTIIVLFHCENCKHVQDHDTGHASCRQITSLRSYTLEQISKL
jgi:hypothetical protein